MCWWESGSETYRRMQRDWLEHPHPLGDLNGHSWRGRRRRRGRGRRESFVPFSVFSHSIPILSLHFLTREGRWFRPALKPLAGAHAWINGWRGQKSRSGLLEFSFGEEPREGDRVKRRRFLAHRHTYGLSRTILQSCLFRSLFRSCFLHQVWWIHILSH